MRASFVECIVVGSSFGYDEDREILEIQAIPTFIVCITNCTKHKGNPLHLSPMAAGVELPALLQLIQERQTANAGKLFKKCNLLCTHLYTNYSITAYFNPYKQEKMSLAELSSGSKLPMIFA